MKKILTSILVVLCLILGLNLSVEANSAATFIEGSDANGVIIKDAINTIEVLNEDLTLNLYADDIGYNSSDCKSNLSAKYTFHNKSKDTNLKANLVFPIGTLPSYVKTITDDTFKIKVNDTIIPHKIRYSFSEYNDILQEINFLEDDYIEIGNATPTTSLYLNTIIIPNYSDLLSIVEIDLRNSNNTKIIVKDDSIALDINKNVALAYPTTNEISFYTVGHAFEDLDDRLSFRGWKEGVNQYYENLVNLDYSYVVTSSLTDKTVLDIMKEKILSEEDYSYNISDVDLYNIAIHDTRLARFNTDTGYFYEDKPTVMEFYPLSYRYLNVWAEYELDIKADETITNEVMCPIYPEVDYGYETDVYTYSYYLTPASLWSDFNNLNLIINTDIYVYSCNIGDLTKTDTGYTLTSSNLPDNDLIIRYGTNKTFPDRILNTSDIYFYIAATLILSVPFILCLAAFIAKFKETLSLDPKSRTRKFILWTNLLSAYILAYLAFFEDFIGQNSICAIIVISFILLFLSIYEFIKFKKLNYVRLIFTVVTFLQFITLLMGELDTYFIAISIFGFILFLMNMYTLCSERLERQFLLDNVENNKNHKGYYGVGYISNKQRVLFLTYIVSIIIIFLVVIILEVIYNLELKYVVITTIVFLALDLVPAILLSMYNLRFSRHFTKDYDIKALEENTYKLLQDEKINPDYRTLLMISYLVYLLYYDVAKYEEIYKTLEVPTKSNILQIYHFASIHLFLSKEEFYLRLNIILDKRPHYKTKLTKILTSADAFYFGRCKNEVVKVFKYNTKNKISNAASLMILEYYYYNNNDLVNAKKYKDLFNASYKEFTSLDNKVNELDLEYNNEIE